MIEDRDLISELPLGSEREFQDWYESLPKSDQDQLAQVATTLKRVGPVEGPQTAAFNSKAKVTGYGGAAGGGKSALICLLALLKHTRTVVFRHDAKQLRALVEDAVEFTGTEVGLSRQAGVFVFGDRAGHMMEWGGIGKPGQESAWRGRPHDLIAADECTELDHRKLQFLMTWLRTTDPKQSCRALYTFNPPGGPDEARDTGVDGRWVIDYFAPWLDDRHPNPAQPGEIRYFLVGEDGESEEVESGEPQILTVGGERFEAEPETRTFIPAKYHDNPYLKKTGYLQGLLALPEPFRSQMLLGDFKAGIADSAYQVIPSKWVDEAMARWDKTGRREPMSSMGVDVARGGKAYTSLSRRHGLWWDETLRFPGRDTPSGTQTASLCVAHARDGAIINVDGTGVGASPVDFLRQMNAPVNGVMFAQRKGIPRVGGPMEMYNLRAALWWIARKILDPDNGFQPALPPEKKLRAELIAPRFSNREGKLLVESKDDLIARLGYSPDDAEAFVLSLHDVFNQTPETGRVQDYHRKANPELLYDTPGRSMLVNRGRRGNRWMAM